MTARCLHLNAQGLLSDQVADAPNPPATALAEIYNVGLSRISEKTNVAAIMRGPRVRIHLPPARSLRTIGSVQGFQLWVRIAGWQWVFLAEGWACPSC
jgi:hypothetical protein